MPTEYLWPDRNAVLFLNQRLGLPASGKEQDWEIELADPSRIDEMLDLLQSDELDKEARSALALLTIASMEDADDLGALNDQQIDRIREYLNDDDLLRFRMASYWGEHRGSDPSWVSKIIPNYGGDRSS